VNSGQAWSASHRYSFGLAEQPFEISRAVEHSPNLDAIVRGTIENEVIAESVDWPDPQAHCLSVRKPAGLPDFAMLGKKLECPIGSIQETERRIEIVARDMIGQFDQIAPHFGTA
jgi:hypothetical protein